MRQTIVTFRTIRTTIDKGYPEHAIRTIDSVLATGNVDGDDRETFAVLYGVANAKLASMARDTTEQDRGTYLREMGFVQAARDEANGR
jgi:hypothetical protein